MVDLCLYWISRSLGSTVELCRKLANLCQVSVFPCSWFMTIMTVHMQCIISWPVLAVSSGAELPSVLPVPSSHVWPFPLPDLLVVLNVAEVLVSVLFFSLHLLHCLSLPSLLLSQIGLPTICTWRCDTLVNWGSVSCAVLSQPAFGEILLLPLVVVTGIFLKNKSCLHFSYQECL